MMSNDDFYNRLDLPSPPFLTYKMCYDNPEAAGKKLYNLLGTVWSILNKQDLLHQESATLSRFIYKVKRKLRKDKGLKALEKVNRSLLQYLALDFISVVKKTQESISEDFGPTRQLLEWVLVRLQGFSKLFDNVHNRCLEAGTYLQWRFQTGHIWQTGLVATAIVSRIWAISQELVRYCCVWYAGLKKYLLLLQPSMVAWLPAGYNLPENLPSWLGNPTYISKLQMKVDKEVFTDKSTAVGENMEIQENESNIQTNSFELVPGNDFQNAINEDIGETISRENFEGCFKVQKTSLQGRVEVQKINSQGRVNVKQTNAQSTKKHKKKSDEGQLVKQNSLKKKSNTISTESSDNRMSPVDLITSRIRLIKFMKKETKSRTKPVITNVEQGLTHKMDKLQWRMFENFVREKMIELEKHPMRQKKILKDVRDEIKLRIS